MRKAIIAIASALALCAAAQAGSNAARIDIDGAKDGVSLTPGAAEGGSVSNAGWIKEPERQKMRLTTNFPASVDWKKGSVSFTPDKDGKAVIYLMGQYAKEPEDRTWVIFDGVRADGAEIKNGNFEDSPLEWSLGGPKDGPKASVSDIAKSGSKSLKVNHDSSATQIMELKSGQPVTVTFWYKLGE